MPDDQFRRELLDGELFVSPGCSFAPFDVVYSPHDVLEPDLVVLPAPVSALGKKSSCGGQRGSLVS